MERESAWHGASHRVPPDRRRLRQLVVAGLLLFALWTGAVSSFWALERHDIENGLSVELAHHLELGVDRLQDQLLRARLLLVALASHPAIRSRIEGRTDRVAPDALMRAAKGLAVSVRLIDPLGQTRLELGAHSHRGPAAALPAAVGMFASPPPAAATLLWLPPGSRGPRLAMTLRGADDQSWWLLIELDARELLSMSHSTELAGAKAYFRFGPGLIYRVAEGRVERLQHERMQASGRALTSVMPIKRPVWLLVGGENRDAGWQAGIELPAPVIGQHLRSEWIQSLSLYGLGLLLLALGLWQWWRIAGTRDALDAEREDLLKTLESLRESVEALHVGLMVYASQGRGFALSYCNPSAAQLLQTSRERLAGSAPFWLDDGFRGQSGALKLKRAVEGGVACNAELRLPRERVLAVHLSPSVASGRSGRVVVVLRDISEQAAQEEARRELEREVQVLSQSLIRRRDEQARIWACWLHDDLGQKLSAALNMLHALSASLQDRKASDMLAQAEHLLGASIGDVRRRLNELSPSYVEELGLEQSIRRRLENWSMGARLALSYDVEPALEGLGDERKAAIMATVNDVQRRIEQVMPQAESLDLRLGQDDGRIRLQIALSGSWTRERANELARRFGDGPDYVLMLQRIRSGGGTMHVQATAGGLLLRIAWPMARNTAHSR